MKNQNFKNNSHNPTHITHNSRGISLIALIITIIVIIILAAIVIGGIFNTPNDAKFANFCQEYDRVQTAIRLKYYDLYQKYALKASTEIPTHYEIYNEIATGVEADTKTGDANIDSDYWVEIASTQWGTAKSKLCAKPSVNGDWYLRLNDGKLAYQGFEKGEQDMYYTPTAHVTGSRAQISADILNALTAENAADSETQSGLSSLLLSSASSNPGGDNVGGSQTATEGEAARLANNNIEAIDSSTLAEAFQDAEKVRLVVTGNVPIPYGYYYVTGTTSTGLVISDADSATDGNQYVWIPASSSTMFGTLDTPYQLTTGSDSTPYYGKGSKQSMTAPASGNTGYREPDILTSSGYDNTYYATAGASSMVDLANDMVANFAEFKTSVDTYNGFYIGRYELGKDSSGNTVCKAGVTEMNAQTANGNMWYGLYAKCKTLAANNKVATNMVWGCAWDAMCDYMGSSYSSTTGVLAPGSATGTGTYNDETMHVFDTKSGLRDWTATANGTNGRAKRGGGYGSVGSADYRLNDAANDTSSYYGTRVQLYIK